MNVQSIFEGNSDWISRKRFKRVRTRGFVIEDVFDVILLVYGKDTPLGGQDLDSPFWDSVILVTVRMVCFGF